MANQNSTTDTRPLVERIKLYLATSDDPTMIDCPTCKGKGYHHGFGEDGRDPDWCTDCGGIGSVLHPDENANPDDLLREALEALAAPLLRPMGIGEPAATCLSCHAVVFTLCDDKCRECFLLTENARLKATVKNLTTIPS